MNMINKSGREKPFEFGNKPKCIDLFDISEISSCCAVGSFFVIFSPVTVTEVWVGRGRGSVLSLRARARASNRRQLYANPFPPGSEDDEENLSPERLASSRATASTLPRPMPRPTQTSVTVTGLKSTKNENRPHNTSNTFLFEKRGKSILIIYCKQDHDAPHHSTRQGPGTTHIDRDTTLSRH